MTGPEGWAYQTGAMQKTLRRIGITSVKVIGFPNGPDVNIALAAGSVDVEIIGDTPAIIGRAAGLQTKLVAINAGGGKGKRTGSATALMVLPNGPKRIEELKGKKIGVARGSNMERFLLGILDLKKMTGQVQIVHLLPDVQEAALQAGSVDAVCSPYSALLVQHGFRILEDSNNYPKLTGTGVTAVSEKFLAAHPDFPRVWNAARPIWWKNLIDHQNDYYKFAASNSKIPVALYRSLYPIQLYDAEPFTQDALERLNGSKAFLIRTKIIKQDFPIDDWRVDKNK